MDPEPGYDRPLHRLGIIDERNRETLAAGAQHAGQARSRVTGAVNDGALARLAAAMQKIAYREARSGRMNYGEGPEHHDRAQRQAGLRYQQGVEPHEAGQDRYARNYGDDHRAAQEPHDRPVKTHRPEHRYHQAGEQQQQATGQLARIGDGGRDDEDRQGSGANDEQEIDGQHEKTLRWPREADEQLADSME